MRDTRWSFRLGADWAEWAVGWNWTFAFLGIGVFAVGPVTLTVTWPTE